MKPTVIRVTVANLVQPARHTELDVFVDTSRLYGLLPGALLRSLGVASVNTWIFQTSDGFKEKREVADVKVFYRGFSGPTRVIFGKEGETPVLGSHALDSLGLRLAPETGELKPYPLPLYSCLGDSRAELRLLKTSAAKAAEGTGGNVSAKALTRQEQGGATLQGCH